MLITDLWNNEIMMQMYNDSGSRILHVFYADSSDFTIYIATFSGEVYIERHESGVDIDGFMQLVNHVIGWKNEYN